MNDDDPKGEQTSRTLGAFFGGQLLIALLDAVVIGIGLALLRVPRTLPLAISVFSGGLFNIVETQDDHVPAHGAEGPVPDDSGTV